jgi:glycosyltransferase involved in cell wall biosynthesis
VRHGQTIGVVIPALNEEQAIANVIADIPGWVDWIVVADNGSTDQTRAVAEAAGATVVTELERGYGAACQKGIGALGDAAVIVFLDGDYSDDPTHMADLVDPIARGQADLVIGSRITGAAAKGALTPQQRFGNWLACRLIRHLFHVTYSDLGPFRAIRTEALRSLAMRDRAFGWTVEMQIKAARAGLAIAEVPVDYRPRIGQSKISGTVRGATLAGITILSVIFKSLFNAKPAATFKGIGA